MEYCGGGSVADFGQGNALYHLILHLLIECG